MGEGMLSASAGILFGALPGPYRPPRDDDNSGGSGWQCPLPSASGQADVHGAVFPCMHTEYYYRDYLRHLADHHGIQHPNYRRVRKRIIEMNLNNMPRSTDYLYDVVYRKGESNDEPDDPRRGGGASSTK